MKVMIAVEGSDFSDAAVKKCVEMLGDTDNVEIMIVSAMELMTPPTEPFAVSAEYVQRIDAETRNATNKIITRAESLIRDGQPSLTRNLTTKLLTGSPARSIVAEAEEWGADLIVLGSHGYGFWRRALIGSVSNSVLHHAPCSVLIVRSPELINAEK